MSRSGDRVSLIFDWLYGRPPAPHSDRFYKIYARCEVPTLSHFTYHLCAREFTARPRVSAQITAKFRKFLNFWNYERS